MFFSFFITCRWDSPISLFALLGWKFLPQTLPSWKWGKHPSFWYPSLYFTQFLAIEIQLPLMHEKNKALRFRYIYSLSYYYFVPFLLSQYPSKLLKGFQFFFFCLPSAFNNIVLYFHYILELFKRIRNCKDDESRWLNWELSPLSFVTEWSCCAGNAQIIIWFEWSSVVLICSFNLEKEVMNINRVSRWQHDRHFTYS